MAFCDLASFTEHGVFRVHPCCKHVSVLHPFLFPKNYSVVWIYHILLIHSPANRPEGCFYFLTIVNNTAMSQVLRGQDSKGVYFRHS